MRTLVPALTSKCYRTSTKSNHFPEGPRVDEEKKNHQLKKKKKILETLKHKTPRRKTKYSSLNPGNL